MVIISSAGVAVGIMGVTDEISENSANNRFESRASEQLFLINNLINPATIYRI